MKLAKLLAAFAAALFSLALLTAIAVMSTRVGDPARFVTWPVVAFTALAAVVGLLGVWVGRREPSLLAAGVLPALMLSYFLPVARFPFIAVVLVCLGGLAVVVGGVATGVAAGTGTLMVLFVVLQGPAVECGESSVSSGSGPWWIESPNSASGSGSLTPDGSARGTTQVGDNRYAFSCERGRLTSFERVG